MYRVILTIVCLFVAGIVSASPLLPAQKQKQVKKEPQEFFTVDFLNTKAKGRRFCFIADYSNSMLLPKRRKGVGGIRSLRAELTTTLNKLPPNAKFHLIFFSKDVQPLPQNRWMQGKADVAKAIQWIKAQPLKKGTRPDKAFSHAFTKLTPRPDVIYFLSDGGYAMTPDYVSKLNNAKQKTVIHVLLTKGKTLQWYRWISKFEKRQRLPPAVRVGVLAKKRQNPRGYQLFRTLVPRMSAIATQSGGTFRLVNELKR